MTDFSFSPTLDPGFPDFTDLPWDKALPDWPLKLTHQEQIQHGISRHPVVFVNYAGTLYVIKEFPDNLAQKEYKMLVQMSDARLPCIKTIGFANLRRKQARSSVLFSRYLEASVPYRSLFITKAIEQYQNHLLDAISGLLVQLHLNGFYWGDCSLSNILFRRDAGALQAYLVDAETTEHHLSPLSPMLRFHDLEIMQENIRGELTDLQASDILAVDYPVRETGSYIQQRYRSLWEEVTREEIFSHSELYRVQERIRALNSLGFSVKDIELKPEEYGSRLKLRIFVSDRNFHSNQLMEITGLCAEERQAQQIMNEIHELKAHLSQTISPDISIEAVAYHWMQLIYKPVKEKLESLVESGANNIPTTDVVELYCQILEHKWYLSERAHYDVGHKVSVDDFIQRFN